MELNKKVDQILKELKSGKFNKVVLEGEKLLRKYQDKGYLYNICGLAHQRLNNIENSNNLDAIMLNSYKIANGIQIKT